MGPAIHSPLVAHVVLEVFCSGECILKCDTVYLIVFTHSYYKYYIFVPT